MCDEIDNEIGQERNEKFKEMYSFCKDISQGNHDTNKLKYFGLALMAMQKLQLQCLIQDAIAEFPDDCKSKQSFVQIAHFLKSAFVNNEPESADSHDVKEFCDAITVLCDLARADLVFDEYNSTAMLALDLMFGYVTNLKNGLYFECPDSDESFYE